MDHFFSVRQQFEILRCSSFISIMNKHLDMARSMSVLANWSTLKSNNSVHRIDLTRRINVMTTDEISHRIIFFVCINRDVSISMMITIDGNLMDYEWVFSMTNRQEEKNSFDCRLDHWQIQMKLNVWLNIWHPLQVHLLFFLLPFNGIKSFLMLISLEILPSIWRSSLFFSPTSFWWFIHVDSIKKICNE